MLVTDEMRRNSASCGARLAERSSGMADNRNGTSVRQRRRQKFFKEHPFCCFCGGDAKTTTEDHVPHKALFSRGWTPDDYRFPACKPCNKSTRKAESRVTFFSRLHSELAEAGDRRKLEQRLYHFSQQDRQFAEELLHPTARQLRTAERRGVVQREPGQFLQELPILNAKGPLLKDAMTIFGVKLFCALYYKEVECILPIEGGIAVSWYTNVNRMLGEFPEDAHSIIQEHSHEPKLVHGKLSIKDAFEYNIATTENLTAAFRASFGKDLHLFGIVHRDRSTAREIKNCIYHPPAFHRIEKVNHQTSKIREIEYRFRSAYPEPSDVTSHMAIYDLS